MYCAGMAKSTESQFTTVGVIGRRGSPHVVDSLTTVMSCLDSHGVDVVVEGDTAEMLDVPNCEAVSRAGLGTRCDLVVVVGGDGSLLGVGRDLAHAEVPVLGINRGGLGFLADIAPEQIERQLAEVLKGEFRVEDHFLLEAEIHRDGKKVDGSPALNDVVVHPGSMARMMEFALTVNGEFVYDQRSDGLIIASPTGSTAYALSAGGPIMHPALDAIVIVPMFPHTLTSRPLVVRGDAEILVTIGDVSRAQASCDSQVQFSLERGDTVRVKKYQSPLRLLYTLGHSFYESCRSKLDWASRLGGSE